MKISFFLLGMGILALVFGFLQGVTHITPGQQVAAGISLVVLGILFYVFSPKQRRGGGQMKRKSSLDVILGGILGILGVAMFVISKHVFVSLPPDSPYLWAFALLSIVGLGMVWGSIPILRLDR